MKVVKFLSIFACHGQKWAKCSEYLQNEINPRLKSWVQKIFSNLPLNFCKSHNESCKKIVHFAWHGQKWARYSEYLHNEIQSILKGWLQKIF
jgi:hypothetical protein